MNVGRARGLSAALCRQCRAPKAASLCFGAAVASITTDCRPTRRQRGPHHQSWAGGSRLNRGVRLLSNSRRRDRRMTLQVFIASSTEGLAVAESVQKLLKQNLGEKADVKLWTEKFRYGSTYIEALEEASREADS